VPLGGTGLNFLSVTPAKHDFGVAFNGTENVQARTVFTVDAGQVKVSSPVTIVLTNPDFYLVPNGRLPNNTCATTAPPCMVLVGFKPSGAFGARTGILRVTGQNGTATASTEATLTGSHQPLIGITNPPVVVPPAVVAPQ
jgi:hypothetical protein